MKIAFVVLMLAASLPAAAQSARLAPACGPEGLYFKVKLDHKPQPPGQPVPGRALLVFIHDDGPGIALGAPTYPIGVDGSWAGANHGSSWFIASVDPGEHHLCVIMQGGRSIRGQRVELAHFSAEPGKVYYFRTRLLSDDLLKLQPLDSDEAAYLLGIYPKAIASTTKVVPRID